MRVVHFSLSAMFTQKLLHGRDDAARSRVDQELLHVEEQLTIKMKAEVEEEEGRSVDGLFFSQLKKGSSDWPKSRNFFRLIFFSSSSSWFQFSLLNYNSGALLIPIPAQGQAVE